LAQHAVQGKLSGADTAMARWLVYSHTHRDLPLSYSVFPPILDKLKYAIETNLFLQDEVGLMEKLNSPTGKMTGFAAQFFEVNSKLWDVLGHFDEKDTVHFNISIIFLLNSSITLCRHTTIV